MENDKLISTLTDDEKIRLFNGYGSWETFGAGGKIPSIFMSDGPHGLRKQDFENYADMNKSNVATCFPTASCLASSWNRETLKSVGKAIGLEALKEKVNIVLGPGVNIKRSPLCGRNFEYFSEDPYLAGTLAAEYINGMQNEGIGCSLKHFAANNQEKRRQTSNSIIDERTLHEIYLRPFEIAVKNANPVSIMESYNRVNGPYVSHSKYLLTDVLRNKWNFQGFVISDWGACIDASECVKAGLDLAMPDSNGYFSSQIKKGLAEHVIEMSHVEAAGKRILSAVKKLKAQEKDISVDYAEQHRTAFQAAVDSAVLLKNQGMLPLKPGKIAVVGELAEFVKFQGGGSSHITTADYPDALESLKKEGFQIEYSKGYYSGFCPSKKIKSKNKPLQNEAVEKIRKLIAENKDIPVLFFCGLTERYEGEGFDRKDLQLPEEQLSVLNEILKITKNVAVLNFSGSAVYMPFADQVKAILQLYLAGEACGEACASLVCGKTNPSGKLSETFPYKIEDTPAYENFAPDGDNVEYREGIFVGYRHYQTKKIPVQFPFGFGLSYTTFEYSELQVQQNNDGFEASLKIKNTGSADGKEVVQLYVENPAEDVEKGLRARLELCGFEKVFLSAGQEKTVTIKLNDYTFKAYSTSSKDFETVAGNYVIHAAASVTDLRLSFPLSIEGKTSAQVIQPVPEAFWNENRIEAHTKGTYTMSDSLGDMAKTSGFIRLVLKVLTTAVQLMNKGKSKEDPAVKIAVSAITENPVESLISTSGGAVSEKFARFLVKKAN